MVLTAIAYRSPGPSATTSSVQRKPWRELGDARLSAKGTTTSAVLPSILPTYPHGHKGRSQNAESLLGRGGEVRARGNLLGPIRTESRAPKLNSHGGARRQSPTPRLSKLMW